MPDDTRADNDTLVSAADTIEHRLTPDVVEKLRHVNWRDTELGDFEEEAVKDLGHHTI